MTIQTVNNTRPGFPAFWLTVIATAALSTTVAMGDSVVRETGDVEKTGSGIFEESDFVKLLDSDRHSDFTDKLLLVSEDSHQLKPVSSELIATAVSSTSQNCYRNRVLPSGLLYRSYIAAPHEPRFSSAVLFDHSTGTSRWDATLGSRVGLLRRDRPPRMDLDAWQIDIEGAAMVRLDPQEKMDLESADYRFGLLWTGKRDNLAVKFGYFHVSSHIGDEFLIKNPTFQRINYVKESLIMGASLQASPEWRIYGELAWAVIATGGAEPWQLQTGAEYARLASCPTRGAPFTAINVQMRQEVDFAPGISILSGWQWKSPETAKTFRLGLQFFNGPSNQYEFYQQNDSQLGFGAWYDF